MMMLFESLVVLATASLSFAMTPQGFQPSTQTPLMVSYNGIDGSNGKFVAKEVSTRQPTLATMMQLTGTSYAVMMVDLDIPTNSPPETSTLLHWMQTGLTPASTPTVMNTTAGTANAFLLQMPGAMMAAAPYFGPSPPNRVPLEHRYTQVLVDTSAASQEAMGVLAQAAQQRQGFSVANVLAQAGLTDKVVAGNFFVVANPGPAANGSASTTVGGTGTSTGSGSALGSGVAGESSASPFRNAGIAAPAGPSRGLAMGLAVLVGAVALGL